jgi:hypothetical protein
MNKNHARQQGMTFIGVVIVLGLIAFFVLAALKLVPLYLENFKIVSSLQSLKSEAGLGSKSAPEIMTLLSRRLDINEVRRLTPKDIEIKTGSGRALVRIKYEARESFIGNVDIVAKFDDSVELTGR